MRQPASVRQPSGRLFRFFSLSRPCLALPALALALFAFFAAHPARSDNIARRSAQEAYFSGFDRNGDGRVQPVEYLAYMQAGFDHVDGNGNGRLDDHELPPGSRRSATRERRHHEQAVRQAFQRLDLDGNGWLSLRELTAPPR